MDFPNRIGSMFDRGERADGSRIMVGIKKDRASNFHLERRGFMEVAGGGYSPNQFLDFRPNRHKKDAVRTANRRKSRDLRIEEIRRLGRITKDNVKIIIAFFLGIANPASDF